MYLHEGPCHTLYAFRQEGEEVTLKKNILFISDHGAPLAKLGGVQSGGQNNYVYQLALALEALGAKVDVATHWSDENTPRVERFGKRCRVIRFGTGRKGFVDKNDMYGMLPKFYEEMKKHLPIHQYDLVHTHYWLSGLLGLEMKKEFGLPVVHTSHSLGIAKKKATGIIDERRLRSEMEIMQKATAIIATTKNEFSQIKNFVPFTAPVSVIPIGVAPVFKDK